MLQIKHPEDKLYMFLCASDKSIEFVVEFLGALKFKCQFTCDKVFMVWSFD